MAIGTVALLVIPWAPAVGQSVRAGLIGGAPLTNGFQAVTELGPPGGPFSTANVPTTRGYAAGGFVELDLPGNWMVEFDTLYRPLRYGARSVYPTGSLGSASPSSVITWEFPVLGEYRFRLPWMSPFVGAGPSFRASGNNVGGAWPSNHGIAAEVGGIASVKWLRISPCLRYTRWAQDRYPGLYGRTRQDQVELLLGLSF